MNLQEILDYRHQCALCQKEMVYKIQDQKITVTIVENGVLLKSKNKKGIRQLYRLDGTYEGNPYCLRNIIIHKECPIHPASGAFPNSTIRLKPRSVGAATMAAALLNYFNGTTLDNLKTQACFYSFEIGCNINGTYTCSLLAESIRYYDKEEFWSLYTDFASTTEDKCSLNHGKFYAKISDMLSLHIPPVNTSNIKSPEQFIKKFKLYTLFS